MEVGHTHEYFASLDRSMLFKEFNSGEDGLSQDVADKRLAELGKNVIAEKKKLNALFELLSHFKSPLIIILLITSAISFMLHETVDATIIAIMVILSVAMDFFLEHDAERTAEKLKERIKTKVNVIRDGKQSEVSSENICVGDIILLSAGSLVPADSRLLSANDFFVNQSALTGESFPVEKTAEPPGEKTSSLESSNLVFMGTNVVSGTAKALVIKTGKQSEFGKIAEKVSSAHDETEFEKGISKFGYFIMKVIIFLVLFIFLINSLLKHDVFESFMFAIAVAVGLTPELLPMIMSVTMSKGSKSMASKGVIVKKLSSIPNLGSMDVLCTDKTGTLTEAKIRLIKHTDVLGNNSDKVLEYAYLSSVFQTGINNPLDEALLEFKKLNITAYSKVDEVPFDFVRKKMSVVVEKYRKNMLITKGAPEEVFDSSSYYLVKGQKKKLNAKDIARITKQYDTLSRDGFRVLAIAYKEVNKKISFSKKDEQGLVLLGFISFLDPPKTDVKQVITELNKVGVDVKIITGDNELVTKRICDDIGIEVRGIMLGHETRTMTDDALRIKVDRTTIFARFSPDEKNRVIHALKANGHVVGYLGDGINDAPSLRAADVGISVNSAVDVAKESANIVLTHKSLSVLKDGVLEGRKTFANTLKYVMMGISSNFGNMFSVAVAVLFLPFLPMLPVQILLNNFIYDVSQLTIPTDNVDSDLISKPHRWNIKTIKKFMMAFGPISSLFDIMTFVLLFVVLKLSAPQFQTGWFLESLATQTLVIHIIRTRKIPFIQSRPSIQLFISTVFCVVIGWILPYTPIGKIFGFAPLPALVLISIAVLVLVYLLIVEAVKHKFFKHNEI